MKKVLEIFAISVSFLCSLALIVIIFSDVEILAPEEQEKLKEGKLFWQWESPYGALSMHYIEKGEGSKHILLLHGFRAHTYTWRYLIEPLAEAGYHVWAIDLIGYGLSDKPTHVIYNIDFFCQQIHAFMEAQRISKAHFIGNSMGGGLALFTAIHHPERIHSLTLLSALGYPLDLPFYVCIGRHISSVWAPFLGPKMVKYCLKQIMFNEKLITDEQVDAYALPYRLPNGIHSSLLTLQQMDNQRLIEMGKNYASLSHPMLIIWGEHDTLIPVSHYENFLKDFPHANHLLITNCGHIPQEERPQEVVSSILSFLNNFFYK